MAISGDFTTRDYVLRALAASEIAESAVDPDLRRSFFELAEHWLKRAAAAEPTPAAPGISAGT